MQSSELLPEDIMCTVKEKPPDMHVPQLQNFASLENAMEAINEFEEYTTSNYIVVEKHKHFGDEAFLPHTNVYVHWEGPVINNVSLNEYSGVPFIIVGRKVLGCHLGKDRAVAQKKKYAESINLKETSDHSSVPRRKLIQHTKKMDCPAKLYVYHILKFPDFQITKKTDWQIRLASKKLRGSLEKNTECKTKTNYIILFPQLSDHKNHPVDGEVAAIREKVDPRVRQKITEIFQSGICKRQEVKRLVNYFVRHELFLGQDLPVNSRRRFFPTIKDIGNIMRRFSNQRKCSVLDQSTVLQLFAQWQQENKDHSLYCRPHSVLEEGKTAEDFMMCYQADWQKKLLVKYGNSITLLDATYRTTRYALPLYFLCVRTNVCYVVVGAFVVQQETSKSIEEALQLFRQWNKEWSPSCFMVDFCLEEIKAISSIFTEADIKLCDFHREKAWSEWINKREHGVYDRRKELLTLLRNVALSTNKEEHELALSDLQKNNIWISNTMFRKWFSQKWLSNIEKWAHFYRNKEQHIGVNTNNGLERQHRTLKYSYLESYRNCTLSQMIRILHFGFFPDTHVKYLRLNLISDMHYRKYDVKVPSFLHNRPREFVAHVMQRYYSGIEERHITLKNEAFGVFEVKSETTKGAVYSVCVGSDGPWCTCKDWNRFLMPCKHICAVFRFSNFKWDDVSPLYKKNPLFSLDLDCLTEKKQNLKEEESEAFVILQNVAADQDVIMADLPPRRRSKKTTLIKQCSRGLKQASDCLYLLDNIDILQLLVEKIQEMVLLMREYIPHDFGLPLLPSEKTIISENIHDLPSRKYGKPKQPNLHRVGLKADSKKEDIVNVEEIIGPAVIENDKTWVIINGIRLTEQNRAGMCANDWIDDNQINIWQYLLAKQHPNIAGLKDTLILTHADVEAPNASQVLQIHHIGAHWLISVKQENAVCVYDSMSSTISESLKKQLIKMYNPLFQGSNKCLDVNFFCFQKQKGCSDCGVFAMANATAIAEGFHLSQIQFIQGKMRSHLIDCLEKGVVTMFPHENKKRKISGKKITLTTYCFCHLYEPQERMVECSLCLQWYHFKCVGITKKDACVKKNQMFVCSLCKKK